MFWRVHHPDCPPFAPENASSAPWGQEETFCPRCRGRGYVVRPDGDELECHRCEGEGVVPVERVPGYSCCESREALVKYFQARGGLPEDTPVVVFSGRVVGHGPDGEPLVIPRMNRPRPRWFTWEKLVKKEAKS
jgi:hypothetical protein